MTDAAVEILLVEDNPHDVELTLDALARHHLAGRVHVARDGVEALALLCGSGAPGPGHPAPRPRVILLDLKLPRLDGLEVLRRLKSDPRTRAIPVVVLTSSDEDQDILESYRLGANSYVVKPVDFERFTEAMRQIGLYWLLVNQPPGGRA
jgi:CheY-like chemotaxis protein